MGCSSLWFMFFLVLFSLLALTAAQPSFTCVRCNDIHGNYTSTSTYSKNLEKLLTTISSNTEIDYGFYNFSVGQNPDTVYGVAVCRGDLSVSDCHSCLNDATTRLPGECPMQKQAIGYYYGRCMLRYSDRSLFGVMETSPSCPLQNTQHVRDTDAEKLKQALASLVSRLKDKAAAGDSRYKFATGDTDVPGSTLKLYGLTQCTPDLSPSNCSTCLQQEISQLRLCCNTLKGAGIYGPSCSVEFENYPIANSASRTSKPPSSGPSSADATSRPGKQRSTYEILIIVVVLFLLFMLLASLGFYYYRRRIRMIQKKVASQDQMKCVDSLEFDFNLIQVATDNFSDAKIICKGSTNTFYKSTLPSGQDVAVKRLCRSDRDGEREFDNEVLLLANLQHKNLVKLLGLCTKKDSRLLIYEYQPNKSLDWFLYDSVKRAHLEWETRHKIILGIARGLLYLHEDSQMRVIHRDLKASHILLGVKMNPKISNFSRASLVHADQTRGGSSTIKGTYGYMPPEYVLQGHFSVKSDVFSFGVLLLEIISGQSISSFSDGENEDNLLSFTWRKWYEGKALDVVDQAMPNAHNHTTQILRCIHIALTCVQEAPTCRPTMSNVVFKLNSSTVPIEEPSRPAVIIGAQ